MKFQQWSADCDPRPRELAARRAAQVGLSGASGRRMRPRRAPSDQRFRTENFLWTKFPGRGSLRMLSQGGRGDGCK